MATEVLMQTLPLKGGHLPAVRAGRMRVAKKQGNEDSGPPEKKKSTDKPSAVVNLTKMQAMNILTGALEKLGHNFPEAAQIAHRKPRPTVEKVISPKRRYIIQQPCRVFRANV
ncbi:death-associated protein-like 1 [Rana temporaria]|uniref:death-associated protein-like 1 n=1 Tax=Rana temporaria TaxID=8407 RepID=UPI001AAD6598|nr:death-associated protein-like 1 [Rana temporaria]